MSRILIKEYFIKNNRFFYPEVYDKRMDWILERYPEVNLFLEEFYNKFCKNPDTLVLPYGLFKMIFIEKFPQIGLEFYKFRQVYKYQNKLN